MNSFIFFILCSIRLPHHFFRKGIDKRIYGLVHDLLNVALCIFGLYGLYYCSSRFRSTEFYLIIN